MDDVTALCPRVIVIDHGLLVYDGDLKALVRRVRPDKRLSVRTSTPVDRVHLEALATVVSHEGLQVVLSVAPERLNATIQTLLQTVPVADLAIEDPPLEEVMRELFREARSTEGVAANGRGAIDASGPAAPAPLPPPASASASGTGSAPPAPPASTPAPAGTGSR
jgi:hypothetical protein